MPQSSRCDGFREAGLQRRKIREPGEPAGIASGGRPQWRWQNRCLRPVDIPELLAWQPGCHAQSPEK